MLAIAWTVFEPSRAAASAHEYTLDIPDRSDASYETSFLVNTPGELSMVASWPGTRVLSFRLEGPGEPPLRFQRSGPPPQKLHITVGKEAIAAGREWKLSIRALPARGAVQAAVILVLPELLDPGPAESVVVEASPKTLPASPVELWLDPRTAPSGAPDSLARVFDAVERFRGSVVSASGELLPDPCSWQAPFLKHAASLRDDLASGLRLEESTRLCFGRIADALRRVEDLRVSTDPVLVGAAPQDPLARLSWRSRRNELIHPLEAALDDLQRATRDGRCPRLEDNWPARLVACLTACERHFEERSRLGEDQAVNADLTRDEWDRILSAGGVLEAILGSQRPAADGSPGRIR